MSHMNGPLKLRYAFISSPNPIRASATGAEANVITLQVMISNPHTSPVPISAIAITIPTGEDTPRALSSQDLPTPNPAADRTGNWSFGTSGSVLTIQPATDTPGEITDTLIVTLPGINVNHMPGVVAIAILETYPDEPRHTDSTTYALIKQEADFPVTDFRADPSVFHDFDTPTTLTWSVSDQGKQYSYGLRSNDWQPRDCLNRGECFTWQDGAAGVQSPPVTATTTFTLDVIATDTAGNRSVVTSLTTTARMVVPSVLDDSYIERIAFDRLVSLHWIAFNAVRCSLSMDGLVIDDHAPSDTYRNGYTLLLPDTPGQHQFSLTAHGDSGAQASHVFQNVAVRPPATLLLNGNAVALAITRDSRYALVAASAPDWSASVTMLDITHRPPAPLPATIPIPRMPREMAVTPDGRYALVSSFSMFGPPDTGSAPADDAPDPLPLLSMERLASFATEARAAASEGHPEPMSHATDLLGARKPNGKVAFIDLAARTALPSPLDVPSVMGLAIAPDGRRAYVAEMIQASLGVVDIPNHALATPIHAGTFGAFSLAVTPDGRLALVATLRGLVVVDLETGAPEPGHIPVVRRPMAVAITPDGRLALVVGADEDGMSVVNIAARTVEPARIPVPRVDEAATQTIAITRDGRFALVMCVGGFVTVVDIRNRAVVPGTIAIRDSRAIGISPDGETTVAIGNVNNVVTIL